MAAPRQATQTVIFQFTLVIIVEPSRGIACESDTVSTQQGVEIFKKKDLAFPVDVAIMKG